jgi:hypothetical protein
MKFMSRFSPLKTVQRNLQGVLDYLSARGCQVAPSSAGDGGYRVTRNHCVAEVRTVNGAPQIVLQPAVLIGEHVAQLVDHGFQKFFQAGITKVPATAEQLMSIHQFTEDLKEALGMISLYNEGLGSVSDSYQYDRVINR